MEGGEREYLITNEGLLLFFLINVIWFKEFIKVKKILILKKS